MNFFILSDKQYYNVKFDEQKIQVSYVREIFEEVNKYSNNDIRLYLMSTKWLSW